MFDVGQNTGRIDALLVTYYQAEAELESATEAKLGLTMQGAANAKARNAAENEIIDKYNALAEAALAGVEGEVDGVKLDSSIVSVVGESKVLNQQAYADAWEGEHPKPNQNSAEYKKVEQGTGEFQHKSSSAFTSQAKSEIGAAPSRNDYYEEQVTKNDDGTETKTKVFNDTKYNTDKQAYDKKVQDRAEKLAQEYNDRMDEKCDQYNSRLQDKYDSDCDKWEANQAKATAQAAAYVEAMNGSTAKLSKQRDDELTKMNNEWDSINQQLNADECALDQIAQRAQAVVTATKAEIDSLKSERNSNAQSDFKLFG